MATLTPFDTLDDGGDSVVDLDAALAAASDTSNDFFNDGSCVVVVSNGDASSKTATILGRTDPFGATVADIVMIVPAGKVGMSSFLNPALYNSGGKVTFTLSATTSTKIGVLRLRKIR